VQYDVPDSEAYSGELLSYNVLIGDYEQINPDPVTGNPATNFHRTFYDRYTPRETPHIDRRQPLPSAFAARYIQGGKYAVNTNFQIWREGLSGGRTCADYKRNFGTAAAVREIVRFDEHENATVHGSATHVLIQTSRIRRG
jgi:hypothetical protein